MIICPIPKLDEDEHILAIQLASERRPLKGKQTGNLTSEANSNVSCILCKFKKSKKNSQRPPGANREKENNWIVVHQVKMQQIRSLMAAEG